MARHIWVVEIKGKTKQSRWRADNVSRPGFFAREEARNYVRSWKDFTPNIQLRVRKYVPEPTDG